MKKNPYMLLQMKNYATVSGPLGNLLVDKSVSMIID